MSVEPCPPQQCESFVDQYGRPYVVCEVRPGRPPSTHLITPFAWDAGANSVLELDGDVSLYIPAPVGVTTAAVVGLRNVRAANTIPELIPHGWIFEINPVGVLHSCVWESGSRATASEPVVATDTFHVLRVGETIRYLRSGVVVRTTPAAFLDTALVTACLYGAGDQLP